MLDVRGLYRCDAEIGVVKNDGHTCCRRAVVRSVQYVFGLPVFLEWCEKHQYKAMEEGRGLVGNVNERVTK